VLIQACWHKRGGGGDFKLGRVFPWFIAWFVVASAIRTLGWIPAGWQPGIHLAAEFLIIVALTAIGLSADLRRLASTGLRPVALGLGVWAAVALSSLAVQSLSGQL
jgi:uncharacterized membrane protein YadS